MTDWFDMTQPREVSFQMVGWHNLDAPLGDLEGVDLSGSSLTAAYDTDTRTSGRLRVVGENWIRGSLIRVIVSYPEMGYEADLGTYVVLDDTPTRKGNGWVYEYELQSMLYLLGKGKSAGPLWLNEGETIKHALTRCLVDYYYDTFSVDIQPQNWTASETVVYEAGSARIEHVYDMCRMSGNRCDVNGHGTITVRPKIPLASRPAKFELDLEDPNGIVVDGVTRTSDYLSLPNRVAVEYGWSDDDGQHAVYGWADMEGDMAWGNRGYIIVDYHVVNDLPEPTYDAAFQRAKELLPDITETVEWELECMYLPIWEGDVIDLIVNDGVERYRGKRHCLVKNVEIDLQYLKMKLTLTEADL